MANTVRSSTKPINAMGEEHEYYPAYFVQNGIPSLETAQNMVVFLNWCRDNEYTPYVTTNAGKPGGGGGGCPPLGCP